MPWKGLFVPTTWFGIGVSSLPIHFTTCVQVFLTIETKYGHRCVRNKRANVDSGYRLVGKVRCKPAQHTRNRSYRYAKCLPSSRHCTAFVRFGGHDHEIENSRYAKTSILVNHRDEPYQRRRCVNTVDLPLAAGYRYSYLLVLVMIYGGRVCEMRNRTSIGAYAIPIFKYS